MANDLCISTTCKLTNNSLIPTVFLHDLSILCSFIVSHPLYFSYFIFFSPYILKLISFISPLFFTTSILVVLSFITTAYPHSKLGFVDLVQTMVDKLRLKVCDGDDVDEFRQFEEFEIYKIVFRDPPLVTVDDEEDKRVVKLEEERRLENLFEELDRFDDSPNVTRSEDEEAAGELRELRKLELVETVIYGDDMNSDENLFSVKSDPWRSDSSRSFGSYGSLKVEEAAGELQKLGLVEETPISGEDQNSDENSFSVRSDLWRSDSSRSFGSCGSLKENETRSYSEEVAGELQKSSPVNVTTSGDDKNTVQNSLSVKSISPATTVSKNSGEDKKTVENSFSIKSNSWRLDSSSSFSSYGSMRKEKEWKRTLACKLFEERNNSSNGEEGMDSLWEAYEDDNSSRKSKNNPKKKMIKSKKKSEFKCFVDEEDEEEEDDDDDDDDDDDEDEFMSKGQLCCLKALKLSTGKMNLGMGKPNLVKITKAIKGFGWLHHVGSKHGKRN